MTSRDKKIAKLANEIARAARKSSSAKRNSKLAKGLGQAHTIFCVSAAIGFIAKLLG